MSDEVLDSQCWYRIINDKFKLEGDKGREYGINIDKCVDCKFLITSSSYQQLSCGSRYCKDCFEKLKSKYCCEVCKAEDATNFHHKRDDIFLDKAMIRDLKKTKMTCPDCHRELKLIDLEDHVRFKCESGWESCHRCMEMFKKNTPHVCQTSSSQSLSKYKMCDKCGKEFEKENHKCEINWTKSCPYGCKVEKLSLEAHRNESKLDHLDKCYSILKELDLVGCKRNNESLECEPWLKYTVENLEADMKYSPSMVRSLVEEVKTLQAEIIEEKNINEIIRENLFNQMTELQNTSFDGTITWKVDNFPKIKKEAIDGVQKSIFSPPFYSSRFGYKMCLRLYPNGDATAHGVAMSLFLVIMKGNYDSLLKWPFKQKVTFILMDPEFKTNWIDAFIPSENMSSFAQPRTDMNIPSGSSYFIKFEDMNLNPHKYAKDDSLFIRCIVDCSDIHP